MKTKGPAPQSVRLRSLTILSENLLGAGDDVVLDRLVQRGEKGAVARNAHYHALIFVRVVLRVLKHVAAYHVVLNVGTTAIEEGLGDSDEILQAPITLQGVRVELHVEQGPVGGYHMIKVGNRLD